MAEWIFITMVTSGVALFTIGGTGHKWVRRFVLPGVLSGCLLALGIPIWQCLISGGLMVFAFCLPYGDSVPSYGIKFLVGITYAIPSIIIGISLWIIIVPVLFIVLFWLSNWHKTEHDFTWKIAESIYGLMISASLISAYLNRW